MKNHIETHHGTNIYQTTLQIQHATRCPNSVNTQDPAIHIKTKQYNQILCLELSLSLYSLTAEGTKDLLNLVALIFSLHDPSFAPMAQCEPVVQRMSKVTEDAFSFAQNVRSLHI